jgi:hypothetical protein
VHLQPHITKSRVRNVPSTELLPVFRGAEDPRAALKKFQAAHAAELSRHAILKDWLGEVQSGLLDLPVGTKVSVQDKGKDKDWGTIVSYLSGPEPAHVLRLRTAKGASLQVHTVAARDVKPTFVGDADPKGMHTRLSQRDAQERERLGLVRQANELAVQLPRDGRLPVGTVVALPATYWTVQQPPLFSLVSYNRAAGRYAVRRTSTANLSSLSSEDRIEVPVQEAVPVFWRSLHPLADVMHLATQLGVEMETPATAPSGGDAHA